MTSKPSPSSAGVPLPGASGQDETKAQAACRTCDGHGLVSHSMQDGSFDTENCPECTHHTGTAGSTTPASVRERLQQIVELSAGWDEHGSVGPREPLSWESVGRLAMDLARDALKTAESSATSGQTLRLQARG